MKRFSFGAEWVFLVACLGLWGLFAPPAAADDIKGFRSASFGANEKAVRAAIIKDFPVNGDRIRRVEDKVRRITGLVVDLSVLEPGGPATVSYWLGYSCRCLTRVRVVWNRELGLKPEEASGKLLLAALSLRDHFLGRDWANGVAISNRLIENALILFRGEDVEKRDVLLVASPVQILPVEGAAEAGDAESRRPSVKNADFTDVQVLELIYAVNLEKPDTFKLEEGTF